MCVGSDSSDKGSGSSDSVSTSHEALPGINTVFSFSSTTGSSTHIAAESSGQGNGNGSAVDGYDVSNVEGGVIVINDPVLVPVTTSADAHRCTMFDFDDHIIQTISSNKATGLLPLVHTLQCSVVYSVYI